MAYLDIGLRALLTVVCAAAVIGKVRGRVAYSAFLAMLVQVAVPVRMAQPVGGAILAGEAAIIIMLWWPGQVLLGAGLAAAYMAIFTAGVAYAVRRRSGAGCACFGVSRGPFGRIHVVRNGVLLAVAVTVLTVSGAGSIENVPLAMISVIAGVAAAGLVISAEDLAALILGPRPVEVSAGVRSVPGAQVSGRVATR